MSVSLFCALAVIIILLALAGAAVRVIRGHERGVVYMLGRYSRTAGPGVLFLPPVLGQVVRVDMREQTLPLTAHAFHEGGGLPGGIEAVVRFRVTEADKAVNTVEDYRDSLSKLALKALREKLAGRSPGDIVVTQAALSKEICAVLNPQAASFGVTVEGIELKPPGA